MEEASFEAGQRAVGCDNNNGSQEEQRHFLRAFPAKSYSKNLPKSSSHSPPCHKSRGDGDSPNPSSSLDGLDLLHGQFPGEALGEQERRA